MFLCDFLCDKMKMFCICVFEVPEILELKNGAEAIFGDKTKIFPLLTKYVNHRLKKFYKSKPVTYKKNYI